MDITLAIPNFNGLEGLKKLLPQVTKEEFKNIYVLDDCSTDKSEEYVKKFPKITFVKGKKNLGPAGNRNRILNCQLGDIIFFIDADMELKVRDIMIVTRHLEIECRKKRKKKDFENAMRYFYKKHWGMSDKIFNLLYDIKK